MRNHSYYCLRLLFLFLSFLLISVYAEENLYKTLGVARTATTKEIKQAYRRKALDTHPDKNKGVPQEEAAKAFHKVVHAFETLSDDASRKRYDRTGNSGGQQQQQPQQRGGGGASWSFSWNGGGSSRHYQRRPRPRLKDKFEVKEAQSRILHIASLEQLETIIVDDENDTLERNLLIVFFTPPLEENLMDEMVYPFPFAAMSTQGIWWEDLLQTTAVRFHRSNKLTEFFGIPNGSEMKKPIFIFGKRGQPFTSSASNWSRLETNNRKTFEEWVWDQIRIDVEFRNDHDHPVEIYWIFGTTAKKSLVLEPGASAEHTTMLSHEWWVRDARVDTHRNSPGRHKLTDNSMLITWKITSDEHRQKLIVPKRHCYDLSGHCAFWQRQGECRNNPNFMIRTCSKTCGTCTAQQDEEKTQEEGDQEEDHDEL